MLPMPVISALFLLGLTLNLWGQQVQQPKTSMVRVKARVVEQKYCRGDADAFTVLLGLEIEIANPSKTPVHLLWPMVPWVGKVASSVGDAEAGRFLYEQTASHYPQSPTHFDRLKLEPGKTVSKRSEYYLNRDARCRVFVTEIGVPWHICRGARVPPRRGATSSNGRA